MPDNHNILIPPHNKLLEKRILGILMMFDEYHQLIFSQISANMFYVTSHQVIFNKCLQYYQKNNKLVPELIDFDDNVYIMKIKDSVISGVNIEQYIADFKEVYSKFRYFRMCQYLLPKIDNFEVSEIENLVKKQFESLNNHASHARHISEIIDQYSDEKAYNDYFLSILKTGLFCIDDFFRWNKTDFVIIGGRPGSSKTGLMLRLADGMSRNGHKPYIISIEMPAGEIAFRLSHARARKNGYGGFKKGAEKICMQDIYIDDHYRWNLQKIEYNIETMIKKNRCDVVFIDYLTLIQPPKAESRRLEVAEISNSLKSFTKKYNIPIFCLAQLSRAVDQTKDKRPTMSHLKEAGEIEQDADKVIFTYKPSMYENMKVSVNDSLLDEQQIKKFLQLIVSKNRHGGLGNINLRFEGETQFIGQWGNIDVQKNTEKDELF